MSHILAGHHITTHNNSIANLCRGVGERVLYTNKNLDRPIKEKNGVFEKRLHHYRDQLVKMIGRRSSVTYDQFVDFYSGRRRQIYSEAAASLVSNPVCPRDAYLKTFVKAEKLNLDIKADPVPRVIQPRDPRYNVEVGRFLRPLEKDVYDAIDKLFDSPTIMSSYNSYSQARILRNKWDNYYKPVCIGLDASRFDQHVSAQALRFEHSIYDSIFKSKKLAWLLEMQIHNRGTARAKDGWFPYHKTGSRMSGDMNTSLGNKLLMCLMAKSFIDSHNVECSFANNGDDCLIILDKRNLHKLANLDKYFKDFGFKIVREDPVYEFEQVEFCQTKPVKVNGTWRMVRNYKTCLSKDVTCVNLGHRVDQYEAWLYDVGVCGMSVAGDVPVLGAFYAMLKRLGKPGFYQGFDEDFKWYKLASHGSILKADTPDAHGRYSYWLATGLSPDEQIVMEDYFSTFVRGGDKRQLIETLPYLFK
jgi:hypothetical protein